MAELILTDDEKSALTWLELDDATVGKVVKYTAVRMLDIADELGRIRFMAAAMILLGAADDANADHYEQTIKGYTRKGEERGDWKISIQRLPSNASAQGRSRSEAQ